MLAEIQREYDGAVAFEPAEKVTQANANIHFVDLASLNLAQLRLLSFLHASRFAMDEDSDHTVTNNIRIYGLFDVVLGPRLYQSRFRRVNV